MMTSVSLDQKYVNMLQSFGDTEKIVEELLQRYLLERVDARIDQARQEVLGFETKYGMTYQAFRQRTWDDDEFVATLWANDPTWEDDLMTWQYYGEVLADWTTRRETLLTN